MPPKTEQEWTIHALNIHGLFFERWCAAQIHAAEGWRVRSTNYPVKLPPDPGIAGKESAVDIIAHLILKTTLLTLVIECKKNNPEFVNWILFKSPSVRELSLSALTHGEYGEGEPDWHLVRRIVGLSDPVASEARETRGNYTEYKKNDSKTRTANSAIADAAYQAALGLHAISWEEYQRARTIDASERDWGPREWEDQLFIPVIITTANLKMADFKPDDVDPASGEIPLDRVTLQDVPYAVFDYGIPRHLHPNDVRIERLPTEESADRWSHLQIAIVNSRSLGDFIGSHLLQRIVGFRG